MKQRSVRSRREFVWGAILILISMIVPIVAVDLVARLVFDYRAPHDPPGIFNEFDPITGWSKKPNWEGYAYLYLDGTKRYIRNNSHGFTDRERDLQKSKPRIALIGDSTTEFWEAEEQDRGQFLMEKTLDNKWEVLNMGVRGFSTDQAYLLLKYRAMEFSPDIVVYNFCINDIYGNRNDFGRIKPYFEFASDGSKTLVLRDFPYPFTERVKAKKDTKKKPSLFSRIDKVLLDYSFVYRRASMLFASRDPLGLYRHLPLEQQLELRPYKKLYNAEDEKRLALLLALIEKMKAFLDQQDVRFLLVEGVYGNVLDPKRMAWSVEKYGDVFDLGKVTRLLTEFAEQKGIAFLSVQEQVKERGIRITDIMHPQDYVHLNAAGIRLYSSLVLEKLKSLGWI